MNTFFKTIVDYQLINDLSETLDWLFDDDKFSNKEYWYPNAVGRLSKKIHKLPKFDKKNYHYDAIKNLRFPKGQCRTIKVIFSNGDSESKEFIKHIRNGIAHGHAKCIKLDKDIYIEIKDFRSDGKTQTAYMMFPISYVNKMYDFYKEIGAQRCVDNKRKRKR